MAAANKREFIRMAGATMAGAGLAACGGGQAAAPAPAAFVLVHGAWHGAWCFERVAALLAAAGHAVIARDLPAHGLNAVLPSSYLVRASAAAFAAEASPVGATTLDDYANAVIASIDQLRAAGHARVILVGHSMGGIVLNRVGELAAGKLAALVYLAAHMPKAGAAIGPYFGEPENASALVNPVLVGDPSATGAFRLDPLDGTPSYQAALKAAFYNDVPDAVAQASANLLTPDMPVGPMVAAIPLTEADWGSLPRHYIQTLRDNALPRALQQRFVTEADAFTPGNPTRVRTLDTSHSPFLSQPQQLADALLAIATA